MNREEVEQLAYKLWEDRGRPMGSPEEDWFRALEEYTAGPLGQLTPAPLEPAPALIADAAGVGE
jgi:Protein of unknown function (DUF2934)